MPIVSQPVDTVVWADMCKIKVWSKKVELPQTKAELGEEEKAEYGSRSAARTLQARGKKGKAWDPKTVKAVRLCPFDMCRALEHGAHKVCVGTDLSHAVPRFTA